MSDLSKDNPDIPALDDMSPTPTFDVSREVPAIEAEQSEGEKEEDALAAAYWHPSWQAVQEKFEQKIEAYASTASAIVLKDKPADEFKIDMLVAAIVTAELTGIMEDVKRAVESVDQRPKPAKRPKSGA